MFQPHTSRRWWALIAGYFVARIAGSFVRESTRFPDTLGYFEVDYLGNESRLWPVPLVYSIVTNDTARVMLHIVLGTVAWAFAAHVVARSSRFPHTTSAIILVFGLNPQILRFDLAILSESIGISLMVIFISSTLQLLLQRSQRNIVMWFASLILFSMTRPSQLIVLFLITGFFALVSIRRRAAQRIIFALSLILLSLWGTLQLHNNRSMSELNFYTVLQERVVEDDARFEWFANEGMPLAAENRRPAAYENPSDLPGELLDYLQLPVGQLAPSLMRIGDFPLAQWVRTEGWTTYARYLVTHPGDTLTRLADLSSATLNPIDRDLLPLDHRTVIPRQLFLPWQVWITLGSIAAVVHLRFGRKQFAQLFGASVCVGAAWYALTVLTSGIEHPRHVITLAVGVRLVSLLTILGLFGAKKVTASEDDLVIR